MLKIENTTIKINRGDIMSLTFTIPIDENTNYKFQEGDVLSFGVYGKREMDENPLLYKEFKVEEEGIEEIKMDFTSEEMKIGDLINSPTKYWYEIQLNGEQTVLGYDEEGAKILKLYPEGKVIPATEVEDE